MTSTEFLEHAEIYQRLEWEETTKQDYYLAQIAAEIRKFREGFSKSPKQVSIQDMVLPLKREEVEAKVKKKRRPKKVEMGPQLVKDSKHWAKVNKEAKSSWLGFLGAAAAGHGLTIQRIPAEGGTDGGTDASSGT